MTVRPPRPGDDEAIARLAGQLGYASTALDVSRRLERLRGEGRAAVFVAEEDGAVTGWMHVFGVHNVESDAFAEIGGLVVDESARGHGVGAALVAAAEEWAVQAGYPALRVRSNVVRAEAHRFYERRGFARLKTQAVFGKDLRNSAGPASVPG